MSTLLRYRTYAVLTILTGLVLPASLSAQILDRPVAVVRLEQTVNIGNRALNRQVSLFESQLGRELTSEERREVLESMINEELIAQAADREGIEVEDSQIQQFIDQERQGLGPSITDEQFRLLVEEQIGLAYEDYVGELRKQLLQQRYVQETQRSRLENIPEPDEREIQRVFDENRSEFINPELVRFRHLYIDTREMNEQQRSDAAS
ncbi:MAG: SurA N-terminal domain-containing protein, partial [Spirochaetota bacterium]